MRVGSTEVGECIIEFVRRCILSQLVRFNEGTGQV
jgi:hypothetical protein